MLYAHVCGLHLSYSKQVWLNISVTIDVFSIRFPIKYQNWIFNILQFSIVLNIIGSVILNEIEFQLFPEPEPETRNIPYVKHVID